MHEPSYFDSNTEEGRSHIEADQCEQLRYAVKEFSAANARTFETLDASLGKKVTTFVDGNGRMLCHTEERYNRAEKDDILSVVEAWLLTVDTCLQTLRQTVLLFKRAFTLIRKHSTEPLNY